MNDFQFYLLLLAVGVNAILLAVILGVLAEIATRIKELPRQENIIDPADVLLNRSSSPRSHFS